MKRAVILHGTDASPESNWFPWLKGKLKAEGGHHLGEKYTELPELWDVIKGGLLR